MSGPSRMSDTSMCIKDFAEIWLALLDQLPQLDNLADLFESKHLIPLIPINSQTRGVISTVL